MFNADEVFMEIVAATEQAREKIDLLRTMATRGELSGWDARALSIATTELETAQLWIANARM